MRTIAACAAGCLLATAFVSQALSADRQSRKLSNRPINFVVAYPVGGGMDITARTLASEMERVTGHHFRVENRGGGGGIIGNTHMAKLDTTGRLHGGHPGHIRRLVMNILNQERPSKRRIFEPIAALRLRAGDLDHQKRLRVRQDDLQADHRLRQGQTPGR